MTPPDPRVLALEDERRVLHRRLEGLASDFAETVAASLDTNADDEHDPEGATIAFERSQVTSMSRQLEQRLAEVDAALARVAAGTYGTCTACGRPISPARLEARPAAALCITCASRP
jgi:DnaK suppressor protein